MRYGGKSSTISHQGVVINHDSRGVPQAKVEVWDKDLIVDDLIGSAVTDTQGTFQVEFDETYFRELFLDRQPDLYFKVFINEQLIKSTEDTVLWNVKQPDRQYTIVVDVPVPAEQQSDSSPEAPRLDGTAPTITWLSNEKERPNIVVKLSRNPLPDGTLGDVGLAVDISGSDSFPETLLTIPYTKQHLTGIEANTVRVFRWDEKSGTLRPVWNSSINTGLSYIWARITRPGTYVPIGLPRDRVLQDLLRSLAQQRRLVDSDSSEVMHAVTAEVMRPFLEAPEDALEEFREFMMRIEAQTTNTPILPGEAQIGMGGHFLAFPLPKGEPLNEFKKRLEGLRTPPRGLPEEELFYPPEILREGTPPWNVSLNKLPWQGVDPRLLRPLRIGEYLDIHRWWPFLFSQDWWMYQHDAQHTGHASGASDISSTSVARMFRQSAVHVDGPVVTKPAIVDGKIYIGSGKQGGMGGTFYKIDLATGHIEGEFLTSGTAFYTWVSGIGGTPAIVNNRAYFTAVHGTVYCIDTSTMTPPGSPHPPAIWQTQLKVADATKNQPINNPNCDSWSGPLVVNGRVYIGCGEGESPTTYGFIFCLDAATGRVVWVFCTSRFTAAAHNNPNTLPTAVAAPWAAGAGFVVVPNPAETGSAVWSSCVFDTVLNRIYVGTGNSQYPHTAQPDEQYGSGLLSLDASTGAFRGFFQPAVDDSYWPGDVDIDVPGSATAFTRGGVRLVAFGSKTGSFFILDANTLAPVARRQLLPRVGGSGLPGDRGAVIPDVVPTGGNGENSYGVFGTPALDSATGRLFVGLGGYNGMALDAGAGIDPTRSPFLRSVNWNDLRDAWPTVTGADNVSRYSATRPPMYVSTEVGLSSPAVVNDVVFVTTDKVGIYALHRNDGHCLWTDSSLPAHQFALGPAIYGNYVVMGAGQTVYIYRLGPPRIWPPDLFDPWWWRRWWPWPPPPPYDWKYPVPEDMVRDNPIIADDIANEVRGGNLG